jgi:hypothetical protein
VPQNPYVGLWSRLERFRPEALSELLLDRKVVRIVVMRGTIHLVSAGDALVLRALAQPVLDAELSRHPEYGPALAGVDLGPVLAFAGPLLAERPRSGPELRAALAEQFPDVDVAALAYACRNHLGLVQVPPRGLWGRSAQVTTTTVDAWLGRPLAPRPSLERVVLRYLAAFGPAAVADVAAWSGLTGLRAVVERLRPGLRTFRDERGRELFDLPEAPRPDPDTPAPARFLPEYDNVVLSHADRSRFLRAPGHRPASVAGPVRGSFLHDGVLSGLWRLGSDRATGAATLELSGAGPLTKRTASAVAAEGRRFLRFLAPDAESHDVRFVAGRSTATPG